MRISFSTPYAYPTQSGRPLATDDGTVQAVDPVKRGQDGFVAGTEEEGHSHAARPNPKDTASISSASLQALARENAQQGAAAEQAGQQSGLEGTGTDAEEKTAPKGATDASAELSDAEKEQVRELKTRDAEVRAHEAAHAAAAGSLASGGPSYDYQRGPDGANYAVGGEVGISVGSGNTPEERAANADKAQRAASAPANPSGADRAVAAKAAQVAASARAEIAKTNREESAENQPASAAETSEGPQNGKPAELSRAGQPEANSAQQSRESEAQQTEQQDTRQARSFEIARRAQAYGEVSGASASARWAA